MEQVKNALENVRKGWGSTIVGVAGILITTLTLVVLPWAHGETVNWLAWLTTVAGGGTLLAAPNPGAKSLVVLLCAGLVIGGFAGCQTTTTTQGGVTTRVSQVDVQAVGTLVSLGAQVAPEVADLWRQYETARLEAQQAQAAERAAKLQALEQAAERLMATASAHGVLTR